MEFRAIEPDEGRAFLRTLSRAFSAIEDDEADVAHELEHLEPDRCFAAIDGGEIVGCAGAYSFGLVVPGGAVVPMSAITTVGVLATHRRQGITRTLMERVMAQAREREEPVAGLFASQAAIYGRFGFGHTTFAYELDVLVERAAFVGSYERRGRTRLLPREEALAPMKTVYDAACAIRPGLIPFDDATFAWMHHEGDKAERKHLYAVHEDDDGRPDAYAVYRAKHEWPDSLPHVELQVRHLVGATPHGTADIWRYLLDVDLVHKVTTGDRPVDEVLPWLLEEPRSIRAKLVDGLHARPVDVAVALASRSYAADGRVVLGVRDRFPEEQGTYVLTVEDGVATCVRDDDREPELWCDVNAVGSTYLGGSTWRQLARAGLVEASADVLARIDAMCASDPAPWAPWMF